MLLNIVFKLVKLLFRFRDLQIELRLVQLFLMPLLLHFSLPVHFPLVHLQFLVDLHWLEVAPVLGDTSGAHLLEHSVEAARDFWELGLGVHSS